MLQKVIIYDNMMVGYLDGSSGEMDIRREVAHQLKEVRKSEGMTKQKLADLVGTQKSNVSRLESGRYNPSLDFLIKVAGSLGKELQINVK